MLNKNDPLIDAVQEVMKRNQTEREAVKVVNEYFGIEDRKALPHERQGEWNAAYQQVLSESNIKHSNQQKLDVHEPEKDELTPKDFAMLRAMKKKKIEEKAMNPYAIGMAAVKKSTGDEPPMEKKNITKAHKIAKKIMKNKMEEEVSVESIQEEIAYNLAEQAAFIEENYGEEALVDFYSSLTEEQLEIVEGWMDSLAAGARGAWNSATLGGGKFVRAGADYLAKNAASKLGYGQGTTFSKELDQEREKDTSAQEKNPTAYNVGNYGADAAMLATGVGGLARLGAKGALKLGVKSAEKMATRTPSLVGRAVDKTAITGLKSGVAGHAGGALAGQHKGMKELDENILKNVIKGGAKLLGYGDDAAKTAGAVAGSTGKAVSSGPKTRVRPKKQQTVQQQPAGTMAARAQQLAKAGREAQAARAGSSTVAATQTANRANMAQQAQGARTGSSTVAATQAATKAAGRKTAAQQAQAGRVGGSTVAATQTAGRAKTAQQAQAGRVGGSTVAATQTATRMSKLKDLAAKVKSNRTAIGAGAAGGAAGYVASQVANKPSDASAGVTARKIEAPGRQVSAKEIMSSQQYKQGVKDVGGEAAARKIQPGTNVKGVGAIEKGSNIYKTVEKNLSKTAVPGFERGNTKGGAGR
jgi:hypothetical protein